MPRAIVSRCRVFEFKPLKNTDIKSGIILAVTNKQKGFSNLKIQLDDDALQHLVWASAGDLRNALNALELPVLSTSPQTDGRIIIDKTTAE